MKIAICGDVHCCKTSSIIRGRGIKYSQRLENCLASLDWFEKVATENNCDLEVFLGDFFDSAALDDETITAITHIDWNDIRKIAIVGNHESSVSSLEYSSAKALESASFNVISTPTSINIENIELCFLPYILERDRDTLESYFGKKNKKRIMFSHNDLNGIQLGPIISKTGFDIEEITNNTDLFINGHLHNGQKINNKIINLGNLTGRDFGEDATRYAHNILILDTNTLECTYIENPFAFNFYKIEISTKKDIKKLATLKNNAVVSIKCVDTFIDETKKQLELLADKLVETRLIFVKNPKTAKDDLLDTADLSMDYLTKFVECCRAKLGSSDILEAELVEVCK